MDEIKPSFGHFIIEGLGVKNEEMVLLTGRFGRSHAWMFQNLVRNFTLVEKQNKKAVNHCSKGSEKITSVPPVFKSNIDSQID